MKLAICHPNRKEQARNLCKTCYDKWLKERNPEYRKNQLSNSAKWAKANPDKIKIIIERRKAKEKADPNHKIKQRERSLKRSYGINQNDYETMLQKQDDGCAICFRKAKENTYLHVDHCHKSKRVRGLLCHQCNWYMGSIDADPDILVRLNMYKYFKYDAYLKIRKPCKKDNDMLL